MTLRSPLQSVPTPLLWLVLIVALSGAAGFAARVPQRTESLLFAAVASLVVAGCGLEIRLRRAERGARPSAEREEADPDRLIETLQKGIGDLVPRIDRDPIDELKQAIDTLIVDAVEPIAEARDRLIARRGMAEAAKVLTRVATCERWLNRAWSALTDGYRDEARRALDNAALSLASGTG